MREVDRAITKTIVITLVIIGSAFALGSCESARQDKIDDRFYELLQQVNETTNANKE